MYVHRPHHATAKTNGDVPHEVRISPGLITSFSEELAEGRDIWWQWNKESSTPILLRNLREMSVIDAHELFKTRRTSFWQCLDSGVTIVLPLNLASREHQLLRLDPFHHVYQEERAGHGGLRMSPGYVLWCLAEHCAVAEEGRGLNVQVTALHVDPSGRVFVETA